MAEPLVPDVLGSETAQTTLSQTPSAHVPPTQAAQKEVAAKVPSPQLPQERTSESRGSGERVEEDRKSVEIGKGLAAGGFQVVKKSQRDRYIMTDFQVLDDE